MKVSSPALSQCSSLRLIGPRDEALPDLPGYGAHRGVQVDPLTEALRILELARTS